MKKVICILIFFIPVGLLSAQTITGNLAFCQGGNTLLTVAGTTGTPTFQWQKSADGGINWTDIIPGGNSISYTVTMPASYRVIVSGSPTGSVDVIEYPNPISDFTFTNNICSGNPVQFNSTPSGGTPPYSYNWNFGDASFSTLANPTHVYTSLGCGNASFSASLTVTDANGCSKMITKPINIKQAPDVQVKDNDLFNPFSNCNNNPTPANPNYTLTIQNISPSASCISSYTIDWGDGSTVVTNASFPISHTYTQIGAFNLVVTGIGSNGCNNLKTYIVANQSNPAGSLGTLGATTNLCAPATVPFTITNWQLNSTGTIYVLNFGDGVSVTLPHPLNANYTTDTVLHTYTTSSCPTPTYTATLQVINACATTPYSAGNIQIRIKPIAAFSSPASACISTPICFTNLTVPGSTGNNCSNATAFSWDFGDGSPVNTTTSPCHTYSALGTYIVTLTATNPCGTTTATRQICVVNSATSSFVIDNNLGCIPIQVNATNTSNTLGNCVTATYAWSVSYSPSNCGTNSQWTFTNNTNASSIHPSFIFTGAGTYSIILTVTNACGTVNSNKTIVVKKPPVVSINSMASQCAPATITPSATITNCGTSALNYSWTFPGGNPPGSTQISPGLITYNLPGTYTILLNVANECGSTTATQTLIVKTSPATPTAGNNSPICSGSTLNLTSSSSTPGVTYSWIGPAGFTSSSQNPVRTNATIAMSGTYTVTVTANGCSSTPASTIVLINQTPSSPILTTPVNYCQNDLATPLTATQTSGNTLNWHTAATGGTATSTAPTPTTNAVGSTTYYVSQISNSSGCESARIPIVVNVKPKPSIYGNSTDPTSCTLANGTITISGLSPNTTYVVQYSKNSVPVSVSLISNASGIITISNLGAGSYTDITVTLNGCISNAIGPFILVNPSAPPAPSAGSNSPICSGLTLNLTSNSSVAGVSYSWTGPGFTSSLQNPVRANATVSMSGTYVVTVSLNGCVSPPASTIVVVNQTPAIITVTSPINYCQNDLAVPLTATPSAGNILNWYTVPTGGIATNTAPTPQTTIPGATTYYVSQSTPSAGCESARSSIVVNVKPKPSINGSSTDPTSCTSANGIISITGLTPNTSYFVQYNKNSVPVTVTLIANGSGVITITNLSAGLYTDITVTLNGCISNIIGPFTLVNPTAPAAPSASSNSPICSGNTLNLTANSSTSGVTYSWTGPGGYSSSAQNPVRLNATTIMSGTYVVTATLNGCVSIPASTMVVVNQTPSAVTVSSPVSYCQFDIAQPLTATGTAGNTLNWYTASTGGTPTSTAPTPQTSVIGTTTYYVSQQDPANNCEGTRTPIVVNIKPVPIISGTWTDPTTCTSSNGSITITGLAINTSYLVQYNKNGLPVSITLSSNSSGIITISNLSAGTYLDITVTTNGCISNLIGPFTIINPAAPATPTASSNSPLCSGGTLNLTAGSTSTGTITYSWTGPGSFTSSSQNPTRLNVTTGMAGNYFVTITLNGCTSPAASTNVVINQTPSAPTVITPVSYCQNVISIPLNATSTSGNILNWYTVNIGGTPTTTTPIPQTSVTGTTIYYVSQVNSSTGCESSRTPLSVIIFPLPSITGTFSDPTTCSSSDGMITIAGLLPSANYSVQYTKNISLVSLNLTSNASGIITINNLSSGVYSNISVSSNGCQSNVIGPFTLVNPAGPSAPSAGSNSPLCSGNTLNLTSTTTSSGVTYSWTGPTGFTSALQNPVRTNVTVGMSGTYSVTVTLNGCTSSPASSIVIINQTPAAPIALSPINYCLNTTASALTATASSGNTLVWYAVATGGTGTATAPIPQTSSVGITNYYVAHLNSTSGCEGARTMIVVNIKPVPLINGSSTNPTNCGIANGSILISGLISGISYNVQYSYNGSPVTLTMIADASGNIVLNNLSSGTYTAVSVTFNGCISNLIGPFTLTNPPSPATPGVNSNGPLCAGTSLNLTASTTTTGVTYSWIGPGGFSTNIQNPVITNTTSAMSGSYTVTVSVNGCNSIPVSINVIINNSVAITASSNSPLCVGTILNLLSTPSTINNISFSWSGPNGFTSTLQNPAINNVLAAATGLYTVTATLFPGGCSSSSTTSVLVNQTPIINGSFTDPANCVPSNGMITVTGLTPGIAYGIQYTRNGGSPVTNNIIANTLGIVTVTNLSGGVYTNISASLNGCKSNILGPYTLAQSFPAPPSPSVSSNSPLCLGATLKLTSTTGILGATFIWAGPNNFSSILKDPIINNVSMFDAGDYFVSISSNGCTSTASAVNVIIGDYPTVNLGPDLVLPPNTQHIMTSTFSNGPIIEYLWNPATNLTASNIPNPVATIIKDIAYELKVKNSFGCTAVDTVNIKVLCAQSQVYIPDAFTPDGDGINDVLMIRSSGTVTVKYFRIFNKWGQLIFERINFPSNNTQFAWNGAINGKVGGPDVFVYTAEILCSNGTSFFYKGNVSILK